jgi:hypothetical protein
MPRPSLAPQQFLRDNVGRSGTDWELLLSSTVFVSRAAGGGVECHLYLVFLPSNRCH